MVKLKLLSQHLLSTKLFSFLFLLLLNVNAYLFWHEKRLCDLYIDLKKTEYLEYCNLGTI